MLVQLVIGVGKLLTMVTSHDLHPEVGTPALYQLYKPASETDEARQGAGTVAPFPTFA